MSRLRRYPANGHPVFLTLVCDRRQPLFEAAWCARLLLDAIRDARTNVPFRMHAYAVLPDHVHLLVSPTDGRFDTLVHALKIRFAHRYAMHAHGQRRRVWQPRFWDHVVRNAADREHHLNYVHYNPVKHGLVSRAIDWPWSSFRAYAQRGVYSAEWAAAPTTAMPPMGE